MSKQTTTSHTYEDLKAIVADGRWHPDFRRGILISLPEIERLREGLRQIATQLSGCCPTGDEAARLVREVLQEQP